jgi:hypothetical protein
MLSGVSRGTRISGRRSLRTTSAARSTSDRELPCAIADSDPMYAFPRTRSHGRSDSVGAAFISELRPVPSIPHQCCRCPGLRECSHPSNKLHSRH